MNYEYNNSNKNNADYNGSHNLMTPINMDCQPLRARDDVHCVCHSRHCERSEAIYIITLPFLAYGIKPSRNMQ